MLIDFKKLKKVDIPSLNGGEGVVSANMHADENSRIMLSTLPAGASIGLHSHERNSEVNYVVSGSGKAICDGAEEELTAGMCHYCPKGSSHSIINTGKESLVLFTAVINQ